MKKVLLSQSQKQIRLLLCSCTWNHMLCRKNYAVNEKSVFLHGSMSTLKRCQSQQNLKLSAELFRSSVHPDQTSPIG